jgi:hypothetical protein
MFTMAGSKARYHQCVTRLLPPLALAALLALPGCNTEPWTDSERSEAVRMCRGQFGFPPISVFESDDVAYTRFMCQCEVDWIADRLPHRQFENRLQLNEVNRVLAAGGVYCLARLRERDGR